MPEQNQAATTASATLPAEWQSYLEPFAKAIGKSVEQITEAFKPIVGDPGNDAIETLKSEEYVSLDEIKTAVGADVPAAKLKKAVAQHLRVKAQPAPTPTPTFAAPALDTLPAVPDDETWLAALKVGGELKVDKTTVITGIRAALAARTGLFDIPAKLTELMERKAESLSDPVAPEFFKLRKLLTRRNYAEVFEALDIEGGGSFATQARKNAFVIKLDQKLWTALFRFQQTLKGWSDSWQQTFGNPAAMMSAIAMIAGGRGGVMPPGVMAPPDTADLKTAAEGVNDQINDVFAGLGIPVAMAMALDAQTIKKVLETPNLNVHIGAANREEMLKMIGVNVDADYVRLERSLAKYTLGVMEFPKITGDSELAYITSLLTLGTQIPWNRLEAPARRNNRGEDRYERQ